MKVETFSLRRFRKDGVIMCTVDDSIKVINRIIEEKKSKYNQAKEEVRKQEYEFYEGCRSRRIENAKEGADYSKCLTFNDLCIVGHALFLTKISDFTYEEALELTKQGFGRK